jgi:hypothetical protein
MKIHKNIFMSIYRIDPAQHFVDAKFCYFFANHFCSKTKEKMQKISPGKKSRFLTIPNWNFLLLLSLWLLWLMMLLLLSKMFASIFVFRGFAFLIQFLSHPSSASQNVACDVTKQLFS